MCGIAGIFDARKGRPVERALLKRMTDRLAHRGPDGSGLHLEGAVGLGHRRLSIIDLAGGHQPLFNEDETVSVTYNGEIYNFQGLMHELAALGHIFRTRCDTEVIVHAWEEWGPACVERFRGMFAFAIWDRARETLFLARDRLGIKPIYTAELADGQFVFASELKALECHPGLGRELDPRAVETFFALGYIPEPLSIYRGVAKLPAGHTLTVRRGEAVPAPVPYWDVRFAERACDEAEAAERLRALLEDAVKVRLIADVPLGGFLSGGVDSSAVVAAMSRVSCDPVTTCTVGFDVAAYDESSEAALIAERFGTRHNNPVIGTGDLDEADEVARIYDEPFADGSALPTWRLCRETRRHVTVALSGDGGDELFAGYRRYRFHMAEEGLRNRLPLSLRRAMFGPLGGIYPKLDWAPQVLRAKTTLQALGLSTIEAYGETISVMPTALRRELYSPALDRSLGGFRAVDILAEHFCRADTDDPLAAIQYTDIKTYLPGDILTKVDRASMAHALEVRVPILDHLLVEWAATLPAPLKLKDGSGKYIFKQAMREWLPESVMNRRKKGFDAPFREWFRGPLRQRVEQMTTSGPLLGTGFFDRSTLRRIAAAHFSGRRDYGRDLWALVVFDSFVARMNS